METAFRLVWRIKSSSQLTPGQSCHPPTLACSTRNSYSEARLGCSTQNVMDTQKKQLRTNKLWWLQLSKAFIISKYQCHQVRLPEGRSESAWPQGALGEFCAVEHQLTGRCGWSKSHGVPPRDEKLLRKGNSVFSRTELPDKSYPVPGVSPKHMYTHVTLNGLSRWYL